MACLGGKQCWGLEAQALDAYLFLEFLVLQRLGVLELQSHIRLRVREKKCSVIVYKYNLEQILENILICLGQNKMTHEFCNAKG